MDTQTSHTNINAHLQITQHLGGGQVVLHTWITHDYIKQKLVTDGITITSADSTGIAIKAYTFKPPAQNISPETLIQQLCANPDELLADETELQEFIDGKRESILFRRWNTQNGTPLWDTLSIPDSVHARNLKEVTPSNKKPSTLNGKPSDTSEADTEK